MACSVDSGFGKAQLVDDHARAVLLRFYLEVLGHQFESGETKPPVRSCRPLLIRRLLFGYRVKGSTAPRIFVALSVQEKGATRQTGTEFWLFFWADVGVVYDVEHNGSLPALVLMIAGTHRHRRARKDEAPRPFGSQVRARACNLRGAHALTRTARTIGENPSRRTVLR